MKQIRKKEEINQWNNVLNTLQKKISPIKTNS